MVAAGMAAAGMAAAGMEEVMAAAATVSAMCILAAADIMAAEGSTRLDAQAFTAIKPSRHGTARISVRFEMLRSDPEISITR
ncbi:hypothetical protein [Afipia sp. GAS231]|uniref:hypothetical protein n=1 Tax=Afipia sp. GAS231 TaxID=1882747 RepID=UPI001FCD9C52|nr:hypothetical protein [Afipia sp. GAS231]